MIGILVHALPAQQTWRVQCGGGPGVDFTDLPPAVAAAAPGDTILVLRSGVTGPCNPGYTGPLIDKPLRIIGFDLAFQPGNPSPSGAPLVGLVRIQNIAANEQVVLSHLSIGAVLGAGYTSAGFEVSDCAGSVVFEDVSFVTLGEAGYQVRFTRCNDVVLHGGMYRNSGAPM
ncbi:MAG: hypothetical protein AB8H80_12450 [Planctomycetota bacterium]